MSLKVFRVYDSADTDPLRELTSSADELLTRYREERMLDSELSPDLALVHLFSGFRDPNEVIGLGWINTACNVNGYDVSMSTPFPFDILLAAHEIAHNLGAVHDDDVQCLSDESITGAEVMWSELSGNTRPTFSSCSLIKLRQTINSGHCVADNIDMGVTLNTEPGTHPTQHTIRISVLNHDAVRRASQTNSLTTFPLGTELSNASAGCSVRGATLTCQHGAINASDSSVLSVSARFIDIANPIITTELKLDAFMDTRRQDNRAAIQVSLHDALAGSDASNDPSASPASGDPLITDADTLADTPANDQFQPGSGGGSAGVKAGSAGVFMSLLLALFLLLAWRTKSVSQANSSNQLLASSSRQ